MIEEMFGLLFHGIWELIKLLSKVFYKFLKHHPRYACLLPIILCAIYLRFSYIFSSTFFATDAQEIQLIGTLFHGTLLLLGRVVFPANITLGPFYEYLIAPPFWIVGADPIGPAIVSGFLAIASIYLVYLIGKQFFNLQAGLFAAGLYAASSFAISYVHLSWNIDILPFFSLLLLWVIFNAAANARPFLYYLAAGYLLGLCLQLHYMALFLLVLILVYMIVTEIIVKGIRFVVPFSLHFVELLSGFVISMLPFLYAEALKGFPNTKALVSYVSSIAHTTSFGHLLLSLPPNLFMLFARLVVHFPSPDTSIYFAPIEVTLIGYFAMFLLVASCLLLIFTRNRFVSLVLFLWLILGAFSFSFFTNETYDYHFSLLYPVCFLLVGNLLATIFHFADQERIQMAKQLISQTADTQTYTMIPVDATDNKKLAVHVISIAVSVILFFVIILLNLSVLPYRFHSKEQETQIKDIATLVTQKVDKQPFNFALLSVPNTTADPNAYVSAMGKLGDKPIPIQHLEIDPQKKTVTDFLYVVCEDPQCKPLESQVWPVKGFGDAAILDHWTVDNILVYKLVPVINH